MKVEILKNIKIYHSGEVNYSEGDIVELSVEQLAYIDLICKNAYKEIKVEAKQIDSNEVENKVIKKPKNKLNKIAENK